MFKLRLTQWQDCTLCGKKKDNVHVVCHCLALAYKRYKTLSCMFLKPKDLENMSMNVPIISVVANTRLGIVP